MKLKVIKISIKALNEYCIEKKKYIVVFRGNLQITCRIAKYEDDL